MFLDHLSLSIRHRLKLATGPAHAALEERIGPLETQSAYNVYVRGLHAFRLAIENWLRTHSMGDVGAWKSLNIAPTLQDDINDLALMPLADSPNTWRTSSGPSFALGVHYVLEGSALGARVLCKKVAPLGMHREHGARHLWAQAETLESWRGFLIVLAAHNGDEDEIIAGANAAFNAAAGAMERAAHV